VIAAAR
jgi:hypothetical protein